MNRSLRNLLTPVGAGVIVAVLIVGLTLTSPHASVNAPPVTQVCQVGPVVANVTDALTPGVVLNSPYGAPYSDQSSVTTYLGNGAYLTDFSWNGSVWGVFDFANWTIYQETGTSNGSVACDKQFVALEEATPIGDILPLGMYANDSGEPGFFQINDSSYGGPVSGGPIYYWNAFYHQTSKLSTCGTNESIQRVTSDHVDVGVPFTYQGSTHMVNATVPEQSTFHYIFPAGLGSWSIDNLSAPGGPGGGWAFSYLGPC
jgi:hypothetical protein